MLKILLIIILIISFVENSLLRTNYKCSLTSERFCNSGECIDSLKFCDGTVDCQDQSDETEENCKGYLCPINFFQCNYGGCVELSNICDDKRDCIDGSDEEECPLSDHLNVTLVNKRQAACENELHAQCENGNCIPRIDFCDGIRDCADGSDETSKTCLDKIPCRNGFKCKYGGCVSKKKICDGNYDCADESDESSIYAHCTTRYPPTSTTPPNKEFDKKTTCIVPNIPNLAIYRTKIDSMYTDRLYPNEIVESSINELHYICENGYLLREANDLPDNYINYCIGGRWTKRHHANCTKLCSSKELDGVSFSASCNGKTNDCINKPNHLPGTTAEIKCQFNYEEPTFYRNNLICREDGNWDHIPQRCEPKCGIVNDILITTFIHGVGAESTEIYKVPWHTAIFIKDNNEPDGYKNICGGTIINARLILTAAHCFWNRTLKYDANYLDSSKYKIVVGTTARSFGNISRDSQTFSINEIIPHNSFRGSTHIYLYDIALVVLSNSIIFNNYASPICIDKQNTKRIETGIRGKIAGWGDTGINQRPEILQSVEIYSLNNYDCQKKIPQLAPDKFCVDTKNSTGSHVCYGDSGGAFVEIRKIKYEDRHILRGVLSSGYYTVNCGEKVLAGFTDINAHGYMQFIAENEQLYNPI